MKIRNLEIENYIVFFSIILLYFSFQFLNWPFLNIILFVAWLVVVSKPAYSILSKLISSPVFINKILSFFVSIFLLGYIANIFTAWLALNELATVGSLFIVSVIMYIGDKITKNQTAKYQPPTLFLKRRKDRRVLFLVFFILFFVLLAFGFYLIIVSRTGEYISSPWEVLPPIYSVIVFLVVLLVWLAVFMSKRTKTVFLMIILASLLIHSYTLVYKTGFGGDRWRHIGSANRILHEMEYQPTLLTDDVWYNQYGFVKIPRALVDGPKLSYGFEWSLLAITAKISGLSPYQIDKYLGLILWSAFIPTIMFSVAWQIKRSRRFGLFVAASSFIFYPLQYYGSQTLPITFGVVSFSFILLLVLAILKSSSRFRSVICCLFSVICLSYFGYSLSFILAIMALLLLVFWRLRPIWRYLGISLLSILIFIMEWISSFNVWSPSWSLKSLLFQIVRQSNFIYNGAGSIPWINNLSIFHLYDLLFLCLFVFLGWLFIKTKNSNVKFLFWLAIIIFVNYILSWQLLGGLHILSRRLDVFLMVIVSILFAYGIRLLYFKFNIFNSIYVKSIFAFVISLGVSLIYVSGPYLNAMVTENDTQAMQYVWAKIKDEPDEYCVVADTWPLLALEAYSFKQVVAGNFPSDFNHQQPERVILYNQLINSPSADEALLALEYSGREKCYVVLNKSLVNKSEKDILDNNFGFAQIVADFYIWHIE